MSDKKKTAVQYLIEEIKNDSLLQAKSTEEWNEIFRKAQQMEREQIEEVAMYHRDSAVQIDCIRSYMKKNYGGQDEK